MKNAICPSGALGCILLLFLNSALSMTDSSRTCEFPTTSSFKVLNSADDNSDSRHIHKPARKKTVQYVLNM